MRPRRRLENTGGDYTDDELREGYIIDTRGRIRGEARRYNPYSRLGEIMLYDIDAFGFVFGYVSNNWHVMSEEDLLADRKLAKRLYEARYQIWKRHNVTELQEIFEQKNQQYKDNFERFCRDMFNRI